MKTSKITHVEAANPATWANPSTGAVYNCYDVEFSNGEKYNFLAKNEFRKAVGEVANYEVKNESRRTAKLVMDAERPAFNNTSFSNERNTTANPKGTDTQTLIIRQSSMSSACNYYQQRDATEEEVINYARKIEEYVTNG